MKYVFNNTELLQKKKMACLFCLLEFYGLGYFYAILNALDI